MATSRSAYARSQANNKKIAEGKLSGVTKSSAGEPSAPTQPLCLQRQNCAGYAQLNVCHTLTAWWAWWRPERLSGQMESFGLRGLGRPTTANLWVAVCLVLLSTQLTITVGAVSVGCKNSAYSVFGQSCYALYKTRRNFLEAHAQCRRTDDGFLATVESSEEYDFLKKIASENGTSSEYSVWIGLTDTDEEGIFRWINQGPTASPAEFTWQVWAPDQPSGRSADQDCVTLQADGFHVAPFGCSEDTGLFYICEQPVCVGGACTEAVVSTSSSSDSAVIAAVVVVVLLILIVIALLLYTWKFHNDKWELYVCYLCKMRESKAKVHSLVQENQRLRRQLSQQRSVSQISLSGLDTVPGPSDGTGGMLPNLHPMGAGQHNAIPFQPPTASGTQSPPPLRRQTTSQVGTGLISRNPSSLSMAQPRPPSLSSPGVSRQVSFTQRRVTPDPGAGAYPAGPVGPRAAFTNVPQVPAGGPGSRGRMVRNPSNSSQFSTMTPHAPKKVSVVQEQPELEEQEERAQSRASLPGEVDETDTN